MAFKVDEDDEELNALLDAEAPEMIGVKEGEELPLYNDEEDDDDGSEFEVAAALENDLTENEETEVNELPMAEETEEAEEETEMQPFSLFRDKPSLTEVEATIDEEEEVEDKDDNIITTETPTEIEFDVRAETTKPTEEPKKFNLYEDTPTSNTNTEKRELTEEPKLITRSAPVENALDEEEMQQKQMERMERLKNVTARFRSPNSLAELENVPAFKRRNVSLNDQPHSSESSVTRFQVKDEDGTDDENGNKRGGLSDGNSFLHESVD